MQYLNTYRLEIMPFAISWLYIIKGKQIFQ